jgi:hypothetical protein
MAMQVGERIKVEAAEVRRAQLSAWYHRSLSKRPINVVIIRVNDGYYCYRDD